MMITAKPQQVLFLLLVTGAVGCQSRTVAVFELSDEVQSLGEGAEDEEEVAMWRELRDQIASELRQRCGTPQNPRLLGDEDADPKHLRRGAAVYKRRCQPCHGPSGGGNGPVAEYLDPRPRDYRRGIFKFTTMPYGAKPRRSDLLRTVRRGVTGTSMPSFANLLPDDLEAVIDYVRVLALRGELERELVLIAEDEEELDPEVVDEIVGEVLARWEVSPREVVEPMTEMPPMTAESVRAGHKLFLKYACNKCHGKDGRGGLIGGVEIGKDAWGYTAAAADLTSGMFRGGERPIDVYRRIHAGINGTPMPSFATMFADDPEAVWQLVHFVEDLGQRRRNSLPPIEESVIAELEQELAAEAAAEGAEIQDAAEQPGEDDSADNGPAVDDPTGDGAD